MHGYGGAFTFFCPADLILCSFSKIAAYQATGDWQIFLHLLYHIFFI